MHVLYLNLYHATATYTLDVANESGGYATMDAPLHIRTQTHKSNRSVERYTHFGRNMYFPACILLICRINIAAYNKLNMTESK